MLTKYFSKKYLKKIKKKDIPLDNIETKLNNFRQGFTYVYILNDSNIKYVIFKISD